MKLAEGEPAGQGVEPGDHGGDVPLLHEVEGHSGEEGAGEKRIL